MKNATYTKLTKTNTWGLRVEGVVTEGEVVLAIRRGERNGSRKVVTSIVWVGNGVTLVSFKDAPKAPKPYQPDLEAEMAQAYSGEERDGEPLPGAAFDADLPF